MIFINVENTSTAEYCKIISNIMYLNKTLQGTKVQFYPNEVHFVNDITYSSNNRTSHNSKTTYEKFAAV